MKRRLTWVAPASWSLAGVLVTLVTFSPPAFGGPTVVDPSAAKRSSDLFRAGRAAAAAGDDKTACERFTQSDALQPAPGTQLNLGACEAKQGHLLAAREHFRKAGAGFKPDDVRRAVAINSANDLTERLPVLTVHTAEGVPPGVQVTLDGAPLDLKVLEHGIELDPGTTKLVVSADGRKPREYEVVLKEAEKRDLAVDVGEPLVAVAADAPATPASLPPAIEDGSERRKLEHTLGFVGVGVGGAGILVGSIFGILAFHEAGTVRANCTATYACRPAGVSAASSGKTDGIVSTTMFVLGGIFGAAGAYLTVRTWKTADTQGTQAPAAALRVSPLAFPQGGGALATWSY